MSTNTEIIENALNEIDLSPSKQSVDNEILMDSDERRLFDEVVLCAENDGTYYPDLPSHAVDDAIRMTIRMKVEAMVADARAVRKAAIKAVKKSWKE